MTKTRNAYKQQHNKTPTGKAQRAKGSGYKQTPKKGSLRELLKGRDEHKSTGQSGATPGGHSEGKQTPLTKGGQAGVQDQQEGPHVSWNLDRVGENQRQHMEEDDHSEEDVAHEGDVEKEMEEEERDAEEYKLNTDHNNYEDHNYYSGIDNYDDDFAASDLDNHHQAGGTGGGRSDSLAHGDHNTPAAVATDRHPPQPQAADTRALVDLAATALHLVAGKNGQQPEKIFLTGSLNTASFTAWYNKVRDSSKVQPPTMTPVQHMVAADTCRLLGLKRTSDLTLQQVYDAVNTRLKLSDATAALTRITANVMPLVAFSEGDVLSHLHAQELNLQFVSQRDVEDNGPLYVTAILDSITPQSIAMGMQINRPKTVAEVVERISAEARHLASCQRTCAEQGIQGELFPAMDYLIPRLRDESVSWDPWIRSSIIF
mmetsp:Transcript_18658/g.37927  ORF Transcript_18658/g.37927 Transcript_18658/m.37927 type:complete len:429 (-) Transcript_18658:252-1538(-)|eukprot:CAMPEP_0181291758 /NCGR_PEP_ID=MMETSP1101-20121128/2141_1 /TAXON_ID=46948 /ORGANISM="Rhodomonas abbreviata, Strain Caron Lab Isolate" /LENGTH=428 /DNA_ID=CAMNT_0023396177 /DNA_START=152 /DNA_END=1438 /DNA_ORIENTATION=+